VLDNFKKIYDRELEFYELEGSLAYDILNLTRIRAFVYDVCRAYVDSQSNTSMDKEIDKNSV